MLLTAILTGCSAILPQSENIDVNPNIAILLIKDNVVIYKLTGGEPAIHKNEEHLNPLGPLQIF
ncbi:MAG: hypothetical protein G3I10_09205 [Ferrovum sp.]|nr:hypothetical protein [Ferrovum sp.]